MIAEHVNVGIGEVFYDPVGQRLHRVERQKYYEATQLTSFICECWSLTGCSTQTTVEWPITALSL